MKEDLKVITTFSGIGMQERGLENTRLYNLDILNTCETDIYAIIAYAAIHNNLTEKMVAEYSYPPRQQMADELSKMHIGYDFKKKKEYDWNKKVSSKKDTLLQKTWLACKLNKNVGDITLVETFPYCDLLTFSFPCFVEDTLVLTESGYKKICDIKVGEKVLTHTNTFHKVTKVFTSPCPNKLVAVEGKNIHNKILCTPDHPFYVKRNGKMQFVKAKDLKLTDCFAVPKLPLGLADMDSVINLNGDLSHFIPLTYKMSHEMLKMVLDASESVRDTLDESKRYEYELLNFALYNDSDSDYVFVPVVSADFEDNTTYFRTYNLEVETDNTYVVENTVVHNCTDLSLAGLQAGMIKGKTRSGLVYEVLRILENMKEKPRFLLMENVSALVNKKNLPVYEKLNKEFKRLGYNVTYKVLEGSLAGVAQHRERVFALYYQDDIDLSEFEFPFDFDCNMMLKDILHKDVDDKYFVKHKGVKDLINSLLSKGEIHEEDFEICTNEEDYEMIRNIKCKKP